ncbi:MAG: peptide-methionine (S)-S-oxide reductase [Chloroflexi bacterium]|nr:MAG: peptide-methionine (S)-S-oxide reductase [Chloroflexota bacterium]
MTHQLEQATLGGGCFWCVEAVYQNVRGVESVVSGYAGGKVPNPTYREVCSGLTGHAEVVQITFNPDIISFAEILEIFWRVHDPTTPNRQGADVGTQYRSIILTANDEQAAIARQSKADAEAARLWPTPIVTEITPLATFYPAEDYHQEYFNNNGRQPYCQMVVAPKVQKFKKEFANKLKEGVR